MCRTMIIMRHVSYDDRRFEYPTRDDDQQKKYGDMVKTMIDEYGYNEDSAEEILTYAANNLWRDS